MTQPNDTPAKRALDSLTEMILVFPRSDDQSILQMCDSFFAEHTRVVVRALHVLRKVELQHDILHIKMFNTSEEWERGFNTAIKHLKEIADGK